MKTLIMSAFPLESKFIKNALSDLQTFKNDKFTWHKGKFYTKELFLVENSNNITNIDLLLELLMADGGVAQVITIGLGTPLNTNLRNGDILITDQPFGSCQKLTDLFLSSDDSEEETPLRIFAGQIFNEFSLEKNCDSLACLDLAGNVLLPTLRDKGLPALNIRVVVPEQGEENFDSDIYLNIAQKLLVLLKRAVEQAG